MDGRGDQPTVMTVLGPVPADDLGIVLPHEHVFIDLTREYRPDGLLNDVPLAIEELGWFRQAGGRTVVDVTSIGIGRHPRSLREVSERTGLHIVAGTGIYRRQYHDKEWLDRVSTNALADVIMADLNEGIEGTDIRAGIIGELACDEWLTAAEERGFRAAARAQRATGVSITTHAARWPVGLPQLDIFDEEGVDPRRVIIGHCDTVASVEWSSVQDVMAYHGQIAHRGAYVQFDNIRMGSEHALRRRVDYVRNLLDKGHGEQVLLSQDVCLTSHLRAFGGGGYDFVATVFLPLLQAGGVSKAELEMLVVGNPRRALTSSSSRSP